MKRYLPRIVLLIFIASGSSLTQLNSQPVTQPEKRIALVIGNGNYSAGMPLANPENDARSMAEVLQKLGFNVFKYENLTAGQMKKAIDEFGAKLKGNDIGLFFYAGHGIQAKGYNYLIPVDAVLQSEQEVEYECIQADRILAKMEGSGTQVNIIILDACRNNPFERSWTRSSNGRGLAFMSAPMGTLIAYSTAPGSTASDGSGKNSPYTSAILESIIIPDIAISQMFQNVGRILSQKTEKQQVPWISSSLIGDFYFNSSDSLIRKENINDIKADNSGKISFGETNLTSNKILITEVVKKSRSASNTDSLLYVTLNQGRNIKIKRNSYLNLLTTNSKSPQFSNNDLSEKDLIIGHIIILKSDSTKSEGIITFKNDFNANEFNKNLSYADANKTFNSIFLTYSFSPNNFRFKSSLDVRYMRYGKRFGGYSGIGIGRSGAAVSDTLTNSGLFASGYLGFTFPITRSLQFSSGIWSSISKDFIGGFDFFLSARFRKISIIIGECTANFGNEFAETSARIGIGFTF